MQSRSVRSALLALGLLALAASGVRAQDFSSSSPATGGLSADAPGLTIFSADTQRADQGLAVAGWMLYPSIYAGGIYNDNAYATRTDRIGLAGVQFNPSLEAYRDHGLFTTDVSSSALITLYPGAGPVNRYSGLLLTKIHDAPPTNFTGHLTVTESWRPTVDWTVVLSGNASRSNGLVGSTGGGTAQPGASTSPSYVPPLIGVSGLQQYVNSYGGQLAIDKRINERTTIGSTTTIQAVSYDNTQSATRLQGGIPFNLSNGGASSDVQTYSTRLRGKLYVTPQIYVYVTPSFYWYRYDAYTRDSDSWSVSAGAGSDLTRLCSGEIYAGYSEAWNLYGNAGARTSPNFGMRLNYFPTPLLTFRFNAAMYLSIADPSGLGEILPSGSFNGLQNNSTLGVTRQANIQAEYGLNNYTTVSVRGGFGETNNSRSNVVTQAWFAGTSISYNFWRNTNVVINYSFIQTTGSQSRLLTALSAPPIGFQQNTFSAGFKYSY